jgi:hypothetical protein
MPRNLGEQVLADGNSSSDNGQRVRLRSMQNPIQYVRSLGSWRTVGERRALIAGCVNLFRGEERGR